MPFVDGVELKLFEIVFYLLFLTLKGETEALVLLAPSAKRKRERYSV